MSGKRAGILITVVVEVLLLFTIVVGFIRFKNEVIEDVEKAKVCSPVCGCCDA